MVGLIAAPFDSQGRLLQYYPFRLGDVMLPLHACLLLACALNQTFTGKWRSILLAICIFILGTFLSLKAPAFKTQLLSLRSFPAVEANAEYFIARADHQLDLPVAYSNERFILYQRYNQ